MSRLFALLMLCGSLSADIRKIETDQAPKAIGPYSQAVGVGQLVFVSGQIPIDPKSSTIVEQSIEGQTRQVLANIESILQADGLTLDNVVKVEVFVIDLKDFQRINAIYAEKFSQPIKPARQFVQVSRLPHDSLIEISCIAAR